MPKKQAKTKTRQSETFNFEKPSFVFKPNEIHSWRQQGPYLICKSCELVHGAFIGMDKMMIGIDKKGKPILKARGLKTR